MIAKEIASLPTHILLGEGAPSKGVMIVDIINQIIWLFVVNDFEKLPGLLSDLRVL